VQKKQSALVMFVTVSSEKEALRIGRRLVEAGVVACVNVLPHIRSLFRWEGKVSDEPEVLMILKTRASLFQDIKMTIKAIHSYSVPEIIALPIVQGSEDYLHWLYESTAKPKKNIRNLKKC